MGRFLEPDPIGFLGGMNFYRYAKNNPIKLIDPWGFCDELTWGNVMSHYFFGNGEDMEVSIYDVYPEGGLQSTDFGPNGTVVIDTNGPAGQVTFYNNNGSVGVYNDYFDFDKKPKGGRTPIKEFSTTIGSYLPGKPFTIKFKGNKNIN